VLPFSISIISIMLSFVSIMIITFISQILIAIMPMILLFVVDFNSKEKYLTHIIFISMVILYLFMLAKLINHFILMNLEFNVYNPSQ
jgi:hypothetical protein